MSKTAAWVVQIEQFTYAAVSQMELMHIANNPTYIKIPKTPEYCPYVILWNKNIIPVIDISAWLKEDSFNENNSIVAIMIYRDSSENIKYGGIALTATPALEQVNNSQMSDLPTTFDKWETIALSCFINKDDIQVPILDISKIFSKSLSLKTISSH